MKKSICLIVVVLLLSLSFTHGIVADESTFDRTIYVDDDNTSGPWDGTQEHPYQFIQDGIDNASDGDTVFVYIGIYREKIVIDKTISLMGENRGTTIVEGRYDYIVYITADGVNLSGFTFQSDWIEEEDNLGIIVESDNNTITGNNIKPDSLGMDFNFASNNTISFNIISSGICLNLYSNNNTIINNTICGTGTGTGISIYYSSNNTINGNNIGSNDDNGIYFDRSCNNNIIGNIISNNNIGINFDGHCSNNTIAGNAISSNNKHGILIGASNNFIYHNNFINSDVLDLGVNNWDDGYPSGGNYWDDYNGTDNDGDGIGDTPYPIPGGSNQDNYPLMYPHNGTLPSRPNTVYVDDDYNESTPDWQYLQFNTIQNGINAVAEEGTVYVANGTYEETLLVDKTINLMGESHECTVIDGKKKGHVIRVFADHVNISHFTIQNAKDEWLTRWSAYFEVYIRSNFNNISDNIITHTTSSYEKCAGIVLENANYNRVAHNNISNQIRGIQLESSSHNVITGNTLTKDIRMGIELLSSSYNNISSNNIIAFNGVFTIGPHNIIQNNYVLRNLRDGREGSGITIKEDYNKVCSNIIETFQRGVSVCWGNYTNVSYNVIKNCSKGFHGQITFNDTLYMNDFINCSTDIFIANDPYSDMPNVTRMCLNGKAGNIIKNNNFGSGLGSDNVRYMFSQYVAHHWNGNYWGRPRIMPKIIVGFRMITDEIAIPVRLELDWHPAKKPYDIPTGGA